VSDFRENSVKSANFQWVVKRNRDDMDRHPVVAHSDMATLLAHYVIAEALERADHLVAGYPAGHLHAATTGINSSFT
jgi:hypothetical protein